MKDYFSLYKKFFSNENIRHLTMNYSMSSHGARHPEGPVGWILRDEGQVDVYAGKTRLIMGVNGEFVTNAGNMHCYANNISFTTKSIRNIHFLQKHFNPKLFNGQKILAVKKDIKISQYSLIGPNTYVINEDGTKGQLVNTVPITSVFDESLLFEEDASLLPTAVEIFNFVKSTILGV